MKIKYLNQNQEIIHAIKEIEESYSRIAIVADLNKKLIGTLTDGDIRRHLLSGGNLTNKISQVMNRNPIYAYENSSDDLIIDLMKKNNINSIPIVDINKYLVELINIKDLKDSIRTNKNKPKSFFTSAVIMAGGRGKRLMPITKEIPKPMVDINGIPLIERQIKILKNLGIQKVFITVNYLSHVIENYFKEGLELGVDIEYIKEDSELGTVGALSLIDSKDSELLVINADVVTNFDITKLYKFYKSSKADITIAATSYNIEIPYGVIKIRDINLLSIEEKPTSNFLCNAGIYVISIKSLTSLRYNSPMDMPNFITDRLGHKDNITVFPIFEFWSDVGNINDLQKVREFFKDTEI